ncbi:hypothetical protein ACIP4S_13165 [Streptomyces chartreusis]|uniref:hypothetical protein n=1 Tax=Streptomyces chartreusis TaxID=1969 RepID=UPI00380355D0
MASQPQDPTANRDELTPLQRMTLARQLGDVQPARSELLMSFGTAVLDRREHDHTTQREDWFCLNLAAYMGERAAPVLRRLLDAESEIARLRDELAASRSAVLRQVAEQQTRVADVDAHNSRNVLATARRVIAGELRTQADEVEKGGT